MTAVDVDGGGKCGFRAILFCWNDIIQHTVQDDTAKLLQKWRKFTAVALIP